LEVGRSILGVFLYLFPTLKDIIAYSIVGIMLFQAVALCVCRKFSPALWLFAGSVYLAVMFPLTSQWAESLVAAEQGINERRGKEIGLAMRKFHRDRGGYPESLRQLRPQYLKSIPWWWDGLLKRPFILGASDVQCHLKYCSQIGTDRLLGMDDLEWSTDAL
jgi:hypothetical protein